MQERVGSHIIFAMMERREKEGDDSCEFHEKYGIKWESCKGWLGWGG